MTRLIGCIGRRRIGRFDQVAHARLDAQRRTLATHSDAELRQDDELTDIRSEVADLQLRVATLAAQIDAERSKSAQLWLAVQLLQAPPCIIG